MSDPAKDEIVADCFRKAEAAIRETLKQPYASAAVDAVREALVPDEHKKYLEKMRERTLGSLQKSLGPNLFNSGYNTDVYKPTGARMTFEEIFERDARWMSGRTVLGTILYHIKGKPMEPGKPLSVVRHPHIQSSISIEVPLPLVYDEVTGENVSILLALPPEVSGLVKDQLDLAVSAYLGEDGRRMLTSFLRAEVSRVTLQEIESNLQIIERDRRAQDRGQLWQVVAEYFGMPEFPLGPDTRFTASFTSSPA